MKHIGIIGSCVIDYLCSYVNKMPILGEHVLFDHFDIGTGGNGNNVAINLSKLGAKIDFFSCAIGNDKNGEFILDCLKREKVPLSGIRVLKSCSTGVSIVNIASNYDKRIFQYIGANREFSVDMVDFEKIGKLDFLLITGFLLMDNFMDDLKLVLSFCKKKNIKVIAGLTSVNDSSRRDKLVEFLPYIDYLFLNDCELKFFAFSSVLTKDGIEFFHKHGVKNVIVTLGDEGVSVSNILGDYFSLKAYPVSVKDTTGAGDAFMAGFVYGLLSKDSQYICAHRGLYVASKCIEYISSSRGLDFIDPEFAKNFDAIKLE